MNTSILVASFRYLNITKLMVSLSIWIYNELTKIKYNNRKFESAIKTCDIEVIRSLIILTVDDYIAESIINNFSCNDSNNNIQIKIKPLVDANIPRLNEVLLIHSCCFGLFNFAKKLIENGADVQYGNNSSLNFACANGNSPELVTLLLESGADVHADYEYPLRTASWNSNDKIIEVLLKYGADPRAIINEHDVRNNNFDAYTNKRMLFEAESKQ